MIARFMAVFPSEREVLDIEVFFNNMVADITASLKKVLITIGRNAPRLVLKKSRPFSD